MDSSDRAVILLSGLPQLNNTLRLAAHEPLRKRIVMNYDLDGMSKEEGRRYIQEKLRGADCTQTVFEENALEAVLNAANGTSYRRHYNCLQLYTGNKTQRESGNPLKSRFPPN